MIGEKKQKKNLFHDMLNPILMSINKVLLGHNKAHSFISSRGGFYATGLGEVSSNGRHYIA